VGAGQLGEPRRPFVGEREAHDAVVFRVAAALEQAELLRPIDQLDRGVVPDDQILSDLADRRPEPVLVAANGQEQLVLAGREAVGRGLLGAPMLECAQPGAQSEQAGVVAIGGPTCAGHGRASDRSRRQYTPRLRTTHRITI